MSSGEAVIDAIDQVLGWEIPDRDVGRVAAYQAALMARIRHDQVYSCWIDQIEM